MSCMKSSKSRQLASECPVTGGSQDRILSLALFTLASYSEKTAERGTYAIKI